MIKERLLSLHLRFDALARPAETLIEMYSKQGELIIYDLMVEGRLASIKDQTGSIEAFIEDFTTQPSVPNLFSAGLDIMVVVSRSEKEAVVDVRVCEWARYFHDHHPQVGYLMACSTDEGAYRTFNKNLRMQRTHTLMEGSGRCNFRIYAIEVPDQLERTSP